MGQMLLLKENLFSSHLHKQDSTFAIYKWIFFSLLNSVWFMCPTKPGAKKETFVTFYELIKNLLPDNR
jgi:hypothetical protein